MKTVIEIVRKILTGRARVVAGMYFVFVSAAPAQIQPPAAVPVQSGSAESKPVQKEATMMKHASGTFAVKLTPQKPDSTVAETANLGRMSIDKEFHGDIEGTSKGEMLSAMSDVKGSAGYVAMERVTATLHGRKGTFVLQHSGTMTRGTPELSVTVVPDSATAELAGLAGSLAIRIEEGKHFYEFDYTLPEAH
jgi:Protein of unknown function (DUF3224)